VLVLVASTTGVHVPHLQLWKLLAAFSLCLRRGLLSFGQSSALGLQVQRHNVCFKILPQESTGWEAQIVVWHLHVALGRTTPH
jgi:hypothetical protein